MAFIIQCLFYKLHIKMLSLTIWCIIEIYLVLCFFSSIVFIQVVDKIKLKGNLEFISSILKIPSFLVVFALFVVLLLETFGGFASIGGIIELICCKDQYLWAQIGITSCSTALLVLLLGQRISQNYVDAKTIVIYFIVALIGLTLVF